MWLILDNFIVIEKLGTDFLPTLFELKRGVDILASKISFLPDKFSDRLMQFLSFFWPNHLPKRMEDYRNKYEHHWIIEMGDDCTNKNEAKEMVKYILDNYVIDHPETSAIASSFIES